MKTDWAVEWKRYWKGSISKLKDTAVDIIHSEKQRESRLK